jgi:hypothetical protein
MDSARVTHRLYSGITSDQARGAHARAWACDFQCWQEKQIAAKAALTPAGNNDRNRQVKQEKEATVT